MEQLYLVWQLRKDIKLVLKRKKSLDMLSETQVTWQSILQFLKGKNDNESIVQ